MAAVPVVISGVIYDKKDKSVKNVTLVGLASLADLKVDGGPMPETPPGQNEPPGIWHDPGGYNPNDPGGQWPPDEPPGETPPFEKKVGWTEESGWFVAFVPTGEHVTPSRK